MTQLPVERQGVYGPYVVEPHHRREVRAYRAALLLLALAQLGLLLQWHLAGPALLWPWLLVMVVSLGAALRWVHIYLVPLHRVLQLFWLLGSLGIVALAVAAGPAAIQIGRAHV